MGFWLLLIDHYECLDLDFLNFSKEILKRMIYKNEYILI